MFDPAPFQPLQVFFELQIGNLSKIYHYPNTPIDFEITFEACEAGYGTFRLTLLDEAGWEVEPEIWRSRDPATGMPGGTLRWGYQQPEGIESGEYTFWIQDYTPRYRDRTFYLTIIGMTTSMGPLHSSNTYSGTLQECLQKIADNMQLTLKIDPEFGPDQMQERGITNDDTTESREMVHHKRTSESDMSFVNRILYFARDQQGKMGYRAIVTDIEGDPTLLITHPKNAQADYSYKVHDNDSVVIDWNPNTTFAAIFDQSDTHVNGHQLNTGYPSKQVLSPDLTKDFIENFGQNTQQVTKSLPEKSGEVTAIYHTCPEIMPDPVIGGAIRQRSAPARTPHSSSLQALYAHLSNWMAMSTAELEVAGDPRIVAYSIRNGIATVDVDFTVPINYFNTDNSDRHYTSGIWIVTSVAHRVGLGGYTTTYSLERPGNLDTPQDGPFNTAGGSSNITTPEGSTIDTSSTSDFGPGAEQ